ncbi:MAG: hypothetical protein AUK44_01370 [Porphyromonadaceae bacterium CG2_30_38_12]|nr:MAG: hypothetical protein AUK44_01370 [Porphyromonadaceae bacterium CG2_30_38_12]
MRHLIFKKILLSIPLLAFSFLTIQAQNAPANICKGIVRDKKTGNYLAFTSVALQGTNIRTVANSVGEFALKVPSTLANSILEFQYIGYQSRRLPVSNFGTNLMTVELENVAVELPEVSVISSDAEALVLAMFAHKGTNYSNQEEHFTAFYRETIRKNRSYVSLSESVVDVYKQAYTSYKADGVTTYKARKKTDYSKVDTLLFKLMGGPFNALYLDLIKYPEMIFTDNMKENYEFSFDRSTLSDQKRIFIVNFKQKPLIDDPLYAGKLYIVAQTMALKSAVFKLNVQNREAASTMFIFKKPLRATVYPLEATYRIDFFEKDNKWYYGYSRIELALRVNWKKKLFHSTFYSTIEMAATEREKSIDKKASWKKERIHPTIVIADEVSGFADPDFWGEFNVIEPEKPIEAAIRKIQKQLQKK